MRIIHCADLHLDSKMQTHLDSLHARQRRSEILHNFERLAQYARTNKVSMILISGDLVDTDTATLSTREYILNVIKEYDDIVFVYLRGNHDIDTFLVDPKEQPKNLYLFDTFWKTFDYQDIAITGKIGNLTSDDYSSLTLSPDKYNIVMLHGQEFAGQKQDGEIINISSLKNKNIDYLALGHIHSYKEATLDDRGIYVYPGCLEGRGWDECGKKGFVLLDIQNKHTNTKFVPFMQREYIELPVDISATFSFHEILNKCIVLSQDISRENIVRFVLTGTYTIDTDKSIALLLHELQNKFYYVDIKDQSTLYIDPSVYQNEISLTGEFIRQVRDSDLDEETKADIITTGLRILKESK